MRENKLADISTDFFVQIIALVKDPKAKWSTGNCQANGNIRLLANYDHI